MNPPSTLSRQIDVIDFSFFSPPFGFIILPPIFVLPLRRQDDNVCGHVPSYRVFTFFCYVLGSRFLLFSVAFLLPCPGSVCGGIFYVQGIPEGNCSFVPPPSSYPAARRWAFFCHPGEYFFFRGFSPFFLFHVLFFSVRKSSFPGRSATAWHISEIVVVISSRSPPFFSSHSFSPLSTSLFFFKDCCRPFLPDDLALCGSGQKAGKNSRIDI